MCVIISVQIDYCKSVKISRNRNPASKKRCRFLLYYDRVRICLCLAFERVGRYNKPLPVITARVRTYDGRLCFHRCVSVQGGSHLSDFRGGLPGLRFSGRGVPGLRFSGVGGPRSQIFGGDPVSDFRGVPGLSKGKNF